MVLMYNNAILYASWLAVLNSTNQRSQNDRFMIIGHRVARMTRLFEVFGISYAIQPPPKSENDFIPFLSSVSMLIKSV